MNIPRNVLFLDAAGRTNAAAASTLLANIGGGAFRGYGADPNSWHGFANGGTPLDVVITLSNEQVGEVCADLWTGRPVTSHWPLPDDPTAAQQALAARIEAFVALPFAELTQVDLQARLDAIGRL